MFKINDIDIVEPIKFSPQREDNLAYTLKTQSGRIIGDKRGWTYANTTLKWGVIPQTQLDFLIRLKEFTITFEDMDGEIKTINASRLSFGGEKQRFVANGKAFYANFEMAVMFPDVYD